MTCALYNNPGLTTFLCWAQDMTQTSKILVWHLPFLLSILTAYGVREGADWPGQSKSGRKSLTSAYSRYKVFTLTQGKAQRVTLAFLKLAKLLSSVDKKSDWLQAYGTHFLWVYPVVAAVALFDDVLGSFLSEFVSGCTSALCQVIEAWGKNSVSFLCSLGCLNW